LKKKKKAFTKRISGRSPEQRGNGLKFVSETIQQNGWHLYFQSGSGSCTIDRHGIAFIEKAPTVTGCLVILDFSGEI
jgi:ABC-type Fe2+-enterobactin transport system substrate-binding protein